MPRSPLFPVLRVGVALAVGGILLHYPRRKAPAVESPRPAAAWVADINDAPIGLLGVGEKATGPLPGQKRPPCVPRVEREVVGACWWPHFEKPPCPPGFYENAGMCLAPVGVTARPPTSITP